MDLLREKASIYKASLFFKLGKTVCWKVLWPNDLIFSPKQDFFTRKQGGQENGRELYHLNSEKLNFLNSRNPLGLLQVLFTRPASPAVDTQSINIDLTKLVALDNTVSILIILNHTRRPLIFLLHGESPHLFLFFSCICISERI